MRTRWWTRRSGAGGGVGLAVLLSGAFVLIAGFGAPPDAVRSTTAAAETCALRGVTPTRVLVGLADVSPRFAVAFTGCTATWSLSWAKAGITATAATPTATIDASTLTDADAGLSTAYVTLKGDDGTSSRTPVRLRLIQRTAWGAVKASPRTARKGAEVTLTSVLGRADWDQGAYAGYAGLPVTVAYRPAGGVAFHAFRTVTTGKAGRLSVRVPASRSRFWRFAFAGNAGTAAATSASAAVKVIPAAKAYQNCTALNRVYPHGVGRPGAVDRVSGSTARVTDFVRDAATYGLNRKSDRDGDGIACEEL